MKQKTIIIGLAVTNILAVLALALFYFESTKDTSDPNMQSVPKVQLHYFEVLTAAQTQLLENNYEEAIGLYGLADSLVQDVHWKRMAANYVGEKTDLLSTYDSLLNQHFVLQTRLDLMNQTMLGLRYKVEEKEVEYDSLESELIDLALLISNSNDELSKLEAELERVKGSSGRLVFTTSPSVSVEYYGEIIDNKANGYGIGVFDGKSTYVGTWNNNLRHGRGKYTWANGDIYEGDYIYGKRQGYGIYYFKSGEKYVGEWKNDIRDGEGTLYDKDGGTMYKGKWVDDVYQRKSNSK